MLALKRTRGVARWIRAFDTYDSIFDPKNNSIGALRLMLASMVIVGHAYFLGGIYGQDILLTLSGWQEKFGTLAVRGFFILSGFLIAASYIKSKSPLSYLRNRILRIMPGFWVCLVVVAVVFGPILYLSNHHTIQGYLALGNGGPFSYIYNNFFLAMRQYDISGSTIGLPWQGALNGSLWSLVYEFGCYLLIGALGFAGFLHKNKIIIAALTTVLYGIYLTCLIRPETINILPGKDIHFVDLPLFFLVGSCWYLFRKHIPMSWPLFCLCIAILGWSFVGGFYNHIAPLLLGYILFFAAVHMPLKNIDKRADISFGVYIYAFPIQQILSSYGITKLGLVPYILLSFLLTLPFAIASFYLVERPAMVLKKRISSKSALMIKEFAWQKIF